MRFFFRITGLDPAGPLFFLLSIPILDHLTSGDADFVDIIHADAGVYGQPVATGTADFWPNRGTRVQPGCPLLSIPLSDNGKFSNSINGVMQRKRGA